MWCEFEPASGSVMAKAIFVSPVAMGCNQRCFCSSDPNLVIMLAQMAGDTTIKPPALRSA